MSVKYTCPECDATLRPAKPIPAGKKIRCPRCDFRFVPVAPQRKPAATAPEEDEEPPIRLAFDSMDTAEDEEDSAYGVEQMIDDEDSEEKKRIHDDNFRDKFHKSKRGPAMAKVVQPANIILWEGASLCLASIVFSLWAIWPLVFNEEPVSADRQRERFLYLGLGVLGFVYGAIICLGASKMQYLESYSWAMAGAIMAAPIGGGILGIVVLRDKKVIEGFEEGIPDYDPIKQREIEREQRRKAKRRR